MPFTNRVVKNAINSTLAILRNVTYEGGQQSYIDEIVPVATDTEYPLTINASELSVFALLATQDMTVKTNAAGPYDEIFNLSANQPLIFEAGETSVIGGDVDSVFVTTATQGRLKIIALMSTQSIYFKPDGFRYFRPGGTTIYYRG